MSAAQLMSAAQQMINSSANCLLSALPEDEYSRLAPSLKLASLAKGTVLYHAGDTVRDCFFPQNGVMSLLSTTEAGETVEISMVGNEGIIGIPAILQAAVTPYEIMVQIESNAMRINAEILKKEFYCGGMLHSLLLKYIHALLCQISQSAVCNRFHTVEQRLCRWLLISRDRAHSDELPLTQEFMAHMLGIPRTNVTMIAGNLQREGLITYKRGLITITDGKGLEQASCECYRMVKKEFDSFYR